jgi:polysaccharide biosynthesis protein PslH
MRILWLKTELLHPIDKGGKIRTYHVLRGLSARNHVTYLCLDNGTAAPDAHDRAREYSTRLVTVPFRPATRGSFRFLMGAALNVFSSLPYAVARWRSRKLESRIREEAGDADVVVCDFLASSVNVPKDLRAPLVLFQHNVEALIWKRLAEVAPAGSRRAYVSMQWRRMVRFEARECRRYARVVAVSETDKALLEEEYGLEGVAVVPTGVDIDYFRPDPEVKRDDRRIVFTGSMDWMPNQDGITWFIDRVLPLVRQRIPDVRLDVVGRHPPRNLVERGAADDTVHVTGFVEDIRPWVQQAAVAVVPLRVGGGTRLKIYEAMAMETPLVSTTIGAEGLPLREGNDFLRADTPAAFADAVIGLLLAPGRAQALGTRAAKRVRAEFGWDRVVEVFEGICRESLVDS